MYPLCFTVNVVEMLLSAIVREDRTGVTQYHLSSPERRRTYLRTNGW